MPIHSSTRGNRSKIQNSYQSCAQAGIPSHDLPSSERVYPDWQKHAYVPFSFVLHPYEQFNRLQNISLLASVKKRRIRESFLMLIRFISHSICEADTDLTFQNKLVVRHDVILY